MPVGNSEDAPASRVRTPSPFLWLVSVLVGLFVVILVVQVALRILFPWDLFIWSESPFMTNMLKLDLGQSLFGSPADGNSFVYSPGLDYLTFALLKPLGLHLDIRFCRLVNVGIGVLAGVFAGFALRRALRMVGVDWRSTRLAWLGSGIAVLVIFKNLTSDITHPDNLAMLHMAGLFLLTITAMQKRSFGLALATMAFAGLGVYAKQTLCVSFVGPALVFARFNPWGWRKSVLLAGIGTLASSGALAVLWHPEFARFYTWEVLARQGVHLTRFYWLIIDLMHADRALLAALGLAALPLLWRSGSPGRQYLQMWIAIGVCSVLPAALAYAKHFGAWNNLIIFQFWLLLLVWPAIGLWLKQGMPLASMAGSQDSRFDFLVGSLLIAFVVLLFPTRFPAHPAMYAACAEIQKQVDADIKAGRKVLIGHGMMYLLRAGVREVPLDRVNTILELKAAGYANLSHFPDRIRQHYYDRLYLTVEDWYPPEFLDDIGKHYQVQTVVKKPECSDRPEIGRYLPLIGDCRILVPRQLATGTEERTTRGAD